MKTLKTYLLIIFAGFPAWIFAQTTTWTGNQDTNWNEPNNWNNGIPTAASDVVIPNADFSRNYPILAGNVTVQSLRFKNTHNGSSTIGANIDFNGHTLTVDEGNLIIEDHTSTAATRRMGNPSTGGKLVVTGGRIDARGLSSPIHFYVECDFSIDKKYAHWRGNTFHKKLTVYKKDNYNSFSGGNTFKEEVTIMMSAGGYWQWGHDWGGADTFEKKLTVNCTNGNFSLGLNTTGNQFEELDLEISGNSTIDLREGVVAGRAAFDVNNLTGGSGYLVAFYSGNAVTFQQDVVIEGTDNARDWLFRAANEGSVVFQGNITVENTGGTSKSRIISLGYDLNKPGTVTLADNKNIYIGSRGFSTGQLRLYKFIQNSSTSTHQIHVTGDAWILMNRNTLGGKAEVSGESRVEIRKTIFGSVPTDTTRITSKSDNPDLYTNCGGNTFKGVAYISNTGRNRWYWGHSDGGGDRFETDAYFLSDDNLTPTAPTQRSTRYKTNYKTNFQTDKPAGYPTPVAYIAPPYYVVRSGDAPTGAKEGFADYPRVDYLPTNTSDPKQDSINAISNQNAIAANRADELQSEQNMATATQNAKDAKGVLDNARNDLNNTLNTIHNVLTNVTGEDAYQNGEGSVVALYQSLAALYNTANTYKTTVETNRTAVNNAADDQDNSPGDDHQAANTAIQTANQARTYINSMHDLANQLHQEIKDQNTIYNASINSSVSSSNTTNFLAVAHNTSSNQFKGRTFFEARNRGRILVGYSNGAEATFEGKVEIDNTSAGAYSSACELAHGGETAVLTFREDVTVYQNGTGAISAGRKGAVIFEKNLELQSKGVNSGNTYLGAHGNTGSVILKGEPLFDLQKGRVQLNNFTKESTNDWTLDIPGTAQLRINGISEIHGNLILNNNTSQYMYLSNERNATLTFKGDVTLRNQSNQQISVAYRGNVVFEGDLLLENEYSFTDANNIPIYFGGDTGISRLTDGNTVTAGRFEKGRLFLKGFQQEGTKAQLIQMKAPLADENAEFSTHRNTHFEAPVRIEANQIRLYYTTFYDEADIVCLEKPEYGGGNTFKKKATFEFQGTGSWAFGHKEGDIFEDEVVFFNNGNNSRMYLAHSTNNNVFADKVTIKNAGTGSSGFYVADGNESKATFKDAVVIDNQNNQNIYVSRYGNTCFEGAVTIKNKQGHLYFGGSSTRANQQGSVLIKNTGSFALDAATTWEKGHLHLKNFTYEPTLPLALNIGNGNEDTRLYIGPGSLFNGNVEGNAEQIYLNGAVYNGTASFEKIGNSGHDKSRGGNVFNGTTQITNNSTNRREMYLATQTGDDFNADVFFVVPENQSGWIIPAYTGNNTFAGNITITGNSDRTFDFGGTQRTPYSGKGSGNVVFDGNGTQNVSVQLNSAAALNFRELNINQATSTSTLAFDKDFTVTDRVNFMNGKIILGDVNMTVENSTNPTSVAVFSPNNSHVVVTGSGTVNREVANDQLNVLFPIGNTVTYTPVTISQEPSATTDVFKVRLLNDVFETYQQASSNYAPAGNSIQDHFVRRSWVITEETDGGTNAHMTLQWNALAPSDEMANFNRSLVSIVQYNNTTNKWKCTQERGPSIGPPNTRKSSSGITELGVFSVATLDAKAGSDQTLCSSGDFNLSATPLQAPFSGKWVQVSGPAVTFSDDSSPTATVRNITPNNTYVFRWVNQGLEGDCGTGLYDEVTIQVGGNGIVSGITSVSWEGNADANWFNCANWSDFTIPNENIDVIIPDVSTSAYAPVISASGANVKSITLQNGATLAIESTGDFTIEEDLGVNAGATLTNQNIMLVKKEATVNGTLDNKKLVQVTETFINSGNTLASTSLSVIELQGDLANNALLQHTQGTFKFLGNSNTTISGTVAPVLYNVNIDKAINTTVHLSQKVYIAGTINFVTGLVKTSASHLLIIKDDAKASVGNAQSYVNGPLQKIGDDEFVFPIGKNGRWARIAIKDVANTHVEDYFIAEYFPSSYGNSGTDRELSHVSVLEYWDLHRGNLQGGQGSTEAKVALYWEDSEFSQISNLSDGFTFHNFDLVAGHFQGSHWENQGGLVAGNLSSGNVTTTNRQQSFSPWTFASLNGLGNQLPVQIVDFNATALENEVEINWMIQPLSVGHQFELERSRDGIDFEKIATIDGQINTSSYTYLEKSPVIGLNYYRLKILKKGAEATYSSVRAVTIDGQKALEIKQIYPNPCMETLTVEFSLEENEKYTLHLLNTEGTLINTWKGSSQIQGMNQLRLDVSALQANIYIIELVSLRRKVYKEFIKLK